MNGDFGGRPPATKLVNFFINHISWGKAYSTQVWNATKNQPTFSGFIIVGDKQLNALQAAFWRQVYLLFIQIEGITDGVNSAFQAQKFSFFQIYLLNSAGDLEDLIGVYTDEDTIPVENPFKIKYEDLPGGQIMSTGMDCSAFVKPIGKQGFAINFNPLLSPFSHLYH